MRRLLELTSDRSYIFGICYGNTPSDSKTFDYSIAARVAGDFKETDVPAGFRLSEIPARTCHKLTAGKCKPSVTDIFPDAETAENIK